MVLRHLFATALLAEKNSGEVDFMSAGPGLGVGVAKEVSKKGGQVWRGGWLYLGSATSKDMAIYSRVVFLFPAMVGEGVFSEPPLCDWSPLGHLR